MPAHMPVGNEHKGSRPVRRSPQHTSADVTCAILAPVASEPARDSINVYTIALYVLVFTKFQRQWGQIAIQPYQTKISFFPIVMLAFTF